MVISHSNKFIFVRTPKNASTSIAAWLVNNYCDKNDIYTHIGDARIGNNNVPQKVIDKYRKQYQFIHLTPRQIIQEGIIDKETFLSYKLYGVLRNPLERVVSLYCFKHKNNDIKNFRSVVKEHGHIPGDINNARSQYEYFTVDGVLVANIWLYDNLSKHLTEFAGTHVNIPKFKTQFRKTPWEEFYDDATRNAVIKYFRDDYELYMEKTA